jgi:hypothetical protein
LGVVHNDSRANAAAFAQAERAAWPGLTDPKNQIAGAYGVEGIPVTIAVGRDGMLRARHVGVMRGADADALVAAAG